MKPSSVQLVVGLISLAVSSLVCLGCDGSAGCVAGASLACTCSDGSSGAQVCQADRTFGPCRCAGFDGGGRDAGGAGADAGDAGPRSDDAGPDDRDAEIADAAVAGTVFESCSDARLGGATADGTYMVDVDGAGPSAPQPVYCDQTTEGGGWTLVYKIANTVPDIADPWFGMVGVGAGTDFPSAPDPLPAGTFFEGPTRDVRWAYHQRRAPMGETRGTRITATGEIYVDMTGHAAGRMSLMGVVASGRDSTVTECPVNPTVSSPVLIAPSDWGLAPGELVSECFYMTASRDVDILGVGVPATRSVGMLAGDDSISGPAGTTTLFWIR